MKDFVIVVVLLCFPSIPASDELTFACWNDASFGARGLALRVHDLTQADQECINQIIVELDADGIIFRDEVANLNDHCPIRLEVTY